MKLHFLLISALFFLLEVTDAAPLRVVPQGNPGFKTLQELSKLSHNQRVRYFKNLPKAMKYYDSMQTSLRPHLFGKTTNKTKKKKSKYGFVFSLMSEAAASSSPARAFSAASRSAGNSWKYFSRSRAVTAPTWRMPRPNSRRAASGWRLASMLASRLSTDFSFHPSSARISSLRSLRRKMSAGLSSQPSAKNWSMVFSPSPSISMARREAKWRIAAFCCNSIAKAR